LPDAGRTPDTSDSEVQPAAAPAATPSPPPARLKTWVMRLTAMAIAAGFSIVLLEVLLRLLAPLDMRENSSWYQAHPVYQFRHRANLDEEFVWVQPYHVHTNSRGLREDGEIAYEAGGETRILVHGDSLTFGNGCDGEETFVRVAEKKLNETSGKPPARLINMGVSAHSPGLEFLYYREEGRKYRPKVVVIAAFCGNDVGDDARFNAFRLSDAGELVTVPYRIPRLKRLTDIDAYQWLIRRSQLIVRVRQVYNWLDVNYFTRGQVAAQAAVFSDETAFERNWPLSRAIWLAFAQQIRDDGATPLFAIIPTAEVIDRQAGRPAGKGMMPTAGAARSHLLDFCREQSFPFIDLTDALADSGTPGDDLYFKGDYHFNELGHRIAGEALAAKLAEIVRD
jgi:hypothetical protein